MRALIHELTIDNDLEDAGFHSPTNEVLVLADFKLNFDQTLFVVNRVDQLRFVDWSVSFAEEAE